MAERTEADPDRSRVGAERRTEPPPSAGRKPRRSRRPAPHAHPECRAAGNAAPGCETARPLASGRSGGAGGDARSAPAPFPRRHPTALPPSLTSFVGRTQEVAAVVDLLTDPDVRLVTLTGPGGVGKTRLATAAAACPLGVEVAFVALAAIRSPELVLPTIALALGVDAGGSPAGNADGVAALADRPLLLVLDNLEQVVGCGPALVELLAACPRLTALVTSRSPLRVSGERRVVVPPLSVPDDLPSMRPDRADLDALGRIESVRLFVERARAVAPGFALTDANAASVAAVCRRLGGLPLAIELAAARVAVLPPTDILARLSRSLPLLTDGPRDQPPRLRSMRDAVAWSHDLVGAPARRLFRRLAVFPGGATLEAVEWISTRAGGGAVLPLAAGDGGDRVDRCAPSVVDLLGELVDAGLVHRPEREGEEPRFGMLEPVREFACERLEAANEGDIAHGRLMDWLLARAEAGDWRWAVAVGPDETAWFAGWEREIANVRAALRWGVDRGDIGRVMRLAGALFLFWWRGERAAEGRGWLEAGLAGAGPEPTHPRALALAVLSGLAHRQDDNDRAEDLAAEAAATWRTVGDAVGAAYADYLRAIARYRRGDLDGAEPLYAAAADALVTAGHTGLAAEVLVGLAQLARDRGDLERAAAGYRDALAEQERAGIAWGAALSRYGYATLLQMQGRTTAAQAHYRESLAYWREIGDWGSVAVCLEGIASARCAGGDARAAARLFGAAHAVRVAADAALPCRALSSYGEAFADVRTRLGAATFAQAWLEGWRLPPDEAIAEASAPCPSPVRRSTRDRDRREGLPALSRREQDVLRLVADGLTDREIAERLFITRRTASDHVGHILRKLGVRSRAEAAASAVRVGLG